MKKLLPHCFQLCRYILPLSLLSTWLKTSVATLFLKCILQVAVGLTQYLLKPGHCISGVPPSWHCKEAESPTVTLYRPQTADKIWWFYSQERISHGRRHAMMHICMQRWESAITTNLVSGSVLNRSLFQKCSQCNSCTVPRPPLCCLGFPGSQIFQLWLCSL